MMMKCDLKENLFPEGRYGICGVGGALRVSMQASTMTKKAKPIIDNIIARWRWALKHWKHV
jgi:hypothetical protein